MPLAPARAPSTPKPRNAARLRDLPLVSGTCRSSLLRGDACLSSPPLPLVAAPTGPSARHRDLPLISGSCS